MSWTLFTLESGLADDPDPLVDLRVALVDLIAEVKTG